MKKRLFLVNYGFTLAGHEYSEYKLVSIKYEGVLDEDWGRQLAEAQVSTWFEQFTDCTPTKFIASTALEASYPQSKTEELADHYDGESLTLNQIIQLIEETKPYTDFIVLKGLVSGDILQALEGPKYKLYVNTMQDSVTKNNYTVIKFKR